MRVMVLNFARISYLIYGRISREDQFENAWCY
jgi:hypothetical protein